MIYDYWIFDDSQTHVVLTPLRYAVRASLPQRIAMKRNSYAIIATLGLLLAIFLTATSSAYAKTGAGWTGIATRNLFTPESPPDDAGFHFTVSPGHTIRAGIALKNLTDEEIVILLEKEDLTKDRPETFEGLTEKDINKFYTTHPSIPLVLEASYIKLKESGSLVAMPFTIRIPEDQEHGFYRGQVYLERADAAAYDEYGSAVLARIGHYITVTIDPKQAIEKEQARLRGEEPQIEITGIPFTLTPRGQQMIFLLKVTSAIGGLLVVLILWKMFALRRRR
jgi:hypothetical protein